MDRGTSPIVEPPGVGVKRVGDSSKKNEAKSGRAGFGAGGESLDSVPSQVWPALEMVELAEDDRGDIRSIAYLVAKRSGRWTVDHVTIQKDFFEKCLVKSGKLV